MPQQLRPYKFSVTIIGELEAANEDHARTLLETSISTNLRLFLEDVLVELAKAEDDDIHGK